jgi:hypothetical protein
MLTAWDSAVEADEFLDAMEQYAASLQAAQPGPNNEDMDCWNVAEILRYARVDATSVLVVRAANVQRANDLMRQYVP